VLTATRLVSLLRLTVRDFRDCEVWCSIDRFTAAVLEQLSEEGSVRWELVEHPYSRDARIIEVVPETASAADARPENTVLPYATRESVPTPSWYPLWSLVVSALALVFMVGPFPFDAYKRHRIGTVASVLALILAIGAYWQPGVVKRPMAHAALVVAGLLAVGLFLFMPL
jgi:hypothetical protein